MTVSSQAGIAPVSRNRALFVNFFRRELVTRYLGSTSALLWAFLQPLLLLGVYWFVFTSVFRTAAFGRTSFLLFVAVALWPWLAAQESLTRATVSMPAYGALIRKVAFPHEIVVYASVAATFALQFAGYLVVLVVLSAFGEPVRFEGLVARDSRLGDLWHSVSPGSPWRSPRCRSSCATSSTCSRRC